MLENLVMAYRQIKRLARHCQPVAAAASFFRKAVANLLPASDS
jgi:hypothetical protein